MIYLIILLFLVILALVFYSHRLTIPKNNKANTKATSITEKDPVAIHLFNIAKRGVDILEQENPTTTVKDKFNVLIFNVLYLILQSQQRTIANYNKIEEDCMELILDFGLKNQLFNKSYELKDYVNAKNQLYFNEFGKLDDESYIPISIYNSLYEGEKGDLIKIVLWKRHLVSMLNKIDTELNLLLSK